MKNIIIYLIFLLFIIGCASKSIEVNELIDKGDYSEAVKLIKENNLGGNDIGDNQYNYHSVIAYMDLVDLFNQEEYQKVMKSYIENPINDNFLQEDIVKLLDNSFNKIIDQGNTDDAIKYFNKLDQKIQGKLDDIQTFLQSEIEKENNKKSTVQVSATERYLQLMNKGKYHELVTETTTRLDNIGENFFNLANAYNVFYNDESSVYIAGKESLPERFLNSIHDPLPEVEKYISELRNKIESKKNNSEGSYGVVIGMTKEEVLNSSWGEPKKINKTITANEVSEQWVYGYGNYLYFEGNRLVSIQTNN